MPQQNIDVGSAINAGDGEPIRIAFSKINEMMAEIYGWLVANGLDPAFLPNNSVLNGKLAVMPAGTVKANVTVGSAGPADVTIANLAAALPAGSVARAALAVMNESTLLGRALGAGAGATQELTVNQALAILGISGSFGEDRGVINGSFDFWQRGFSFTANGYTADRFRMELSGGTVTTARQDFSLGDVLGGNNPRRFLRQAVSGQSTSGHYAKIEQRLEDVRSFAGQEVTVSFWAKRSAGAGDCSLQFVQNFGAGGSPSAAVSTPVVKFALTGSWARYSATFTVPAVAGKTLGTDGNDYASIVLWTSAGSTLSTEASALGVQTITVDLWGVKIERGQVASPFIPRHFADELALCQRYYEKSYPLEIPPANSTFDGICLGPTQSGGLSACTIDVKFQTRKRRAALVAEISVYNPQTGNVGQMRDGGATVSSATISSPGERGFNCYNTGSALTANNSASVQFICSVEL